MNGIDGRRYPRRLLKSSKHNNNVIIAVCDFRSDTVRLQNSTKLLNNVDDPPFIVLTSVSDRALKNAARVLEKSGISDTRSIRATFLSLNSRGEAHIRGNIGAEILKNRKIAIRLIYLPANEVFWPRGAIPSPTLCFVNTRRPVFGVAAVP